MISLLLGAFTFVPSAVDEQLAVDRAKQLSHPSNSSLHVHLLHVVPQLTLLQAELAEVRCQAQERGDRVLRLMETKKGLEAQVAQEQIRVTELQVRGAGRRDVWVHRWDVGRGCVYNWRCSGAGRVGKAVKQGVVEPRRDSDSRTLHPRVPQWELDQLRQQQAARPVGTPAPATTPAPAATPPPETPAHDVTPTTATVRRRQAPDADVSPLPQARDGSRVVICKKDDAAHA